MSKKIYSLLAVLLTLSITTNAHSSSDHEVEIDVSAEEIVSDTVAEESAEAPLPTENADVEMSEEALTEMVGYLTALGGGIPELNLSDLEIAAIAEGLTAGLTGEKNFDDYSPESIQEAFAEAQARALAIESGAEEIPSISNDSLTKIGLVMVVQSGLVQLGFGAEEAAAINKGFIDGANSTDADPASTAQLPAFQEFIKKRVEAASAKAIAEAETMAAKNVADGKAFLEKLSAEDAEVQKSESGLYYKVIEPGLDPKPTLEDEVLVHYKGTLIDGTKFDSSYDRGKPAEFPLNAVVPGFGEGLTKVGAGGRIMLYIPSSLGYGNSPRPGGVIKPGDTLIFECELIGLNP